MEEEIRLKKLKWKLLFYFMMVILLIVGLSSFIIMSIMDSNEKTESILEEEFTLFSLDEEKKFNISQQIAVTRGYLLYGEEDYKERFLELSERNNQLAEVLQQYETSSEVNSVLTLARVWQDGVLERVFSMYDNGREEDARVLFRANYEPTARSLMASLANFSEEQQSSINESGQSVIMEGEQVIQMIVMVSAIVVLLSVILSMVAASQITKPIILVTERMKTIAQGDLPSIPLKTNNKDEVGQLVSAVNNMNEQLRNLVTDISTVSNSVLIKGQHLSISADEVREGGNQIATTMLELAEGASVQAESSSSLSTKMSLFSKTISSSASLGEAAQSKAIDMLSLTEAGGDNMKNTINKVNEINVNFKYAMERVEGLDNQTKNISQLTQVIQEIADQTNLLALNAAIEAARAGEHGRGFAVVADEVRKLAEQVSTSITSITGIITTIQRESKEVVQVLSQGYKIVEEGTTQMEKTNLSFSRINDQVIQVSEEMNIIATSLYDIVESTSEINQEIEQIAAVSEEAAAGIEQTSASAEEANATMNQVYETTKNLEEDAVKLQQQLSQFRIEERIVEIADETMEQQIEEGNPNK